MGNVKDEKHANHRQNVKVKHNLIILKKHQRSVDSFNNGIEIG
jgi:hypothetical protein